MPQNPAAIYVHIPFCARRCPYCDFAVSVNSRADFRQRYVRALGREIEISLENRPKISSIYFGGGTPTELSPDDLNSLLSAIFERVELEENAEISLEANPENLSESVLRELRGGGWNRISLGVQSLDDAVLQSFGRVHSAAHVENCLAAARRAGFSNLSLDLIYGAPFTPPAVWRKTLECAANFEVQHVSCYSLTIEEGTKFGVLARRGELQVPDEDSQADSMEIADEVLGARGFSHYEVSNWAKEGFESRHNRNYWRGGDYFGLGCGAHGHFAGHRFWNERDAKTYIARLENGDTARAGEEFLNREERLCELLALGFRTREGFDLAQISRLLAWDVEPILAHGLAKMEKMELLRREETRVVPNEKSLALADGLALKLWNEAENASRSARISQDFPKNVVLAV